MITKVISVENLSKVYRLGQIGTGTFTNDMKVWLARKRGKPNPLLRIGQQDHGNRTGEDLWALRDISFTVEQGEVLGIIGKNGAGKSTLLKILSRVTAPTSGRIRVKGRIASLLEVGTGFHPELTGRENVYLNGAILGMTRAEVDRKFDEIVAFAEVEKFIDTPVKRYSSGMYVRLAFAVAAHLEPEILVVDEVLAVGDAEFQKKCLGKMGEVAEGGRTVLFVSHNMAAIRQLCNITCLIRNGELQEIGNTDQVIQLYQTNNKNIEKAKFIQLLPTVILSDLYISQNGIENIEIINPKQKFFVHLNYECSSPTDNLLIGFDLHSSDGSHILRTYDCTSIENKNNRSGLFESIFEFPQNILNNGKYYLDVVAAKHRETRLNIGSVSLHFSCNSARERDIDYPGLIQSPGTWKIIQK